MKTFVILMHTDEDGIRLFEANDVNVQKIAMKILKEECNYDSDFQEFPLDNLDDLKDLIDKLDYHWLVDVIEVERFYGE